MTYNKRDRFDKLLIGVFVLQTVLLGAFMTGLYMLGKAAYDWFQRN